MRPVRGDEAEDLAKWKPMMILDKTLYGSAYIESLVAQNPEIVTSKSYNRKTLPLEVWYMILDFITDDPSLHRFALVRAKSVKVRGATGQTLACNKINRWAPMGLLKNDKEIENATSYLLQPGSAFDLPNPFHLDGLSKPLEIPTQLFSSKIKSLHVEITVPDFIKHLEYGECYRCSRKRTVCRDVYQDILSQQLFHRTRAFRHMPVMCPVCVGMEASQRCQLLFNELGQAKYVAWLAEELEKRRSEEPSNRCLLNNMTTLGNFLP